MKQAEAKRKEANLLMQEKAFEHSYASILTGLKYTEKRFINNLKQSSAQATFERRKESQNLKKSLLALTMVIQKLMQNIKDEHYVEEHDIDHFKTHLTSTEENIATFKTFVHEQLEVLQQRESEIQQSIGSLTQSSVESTRKMKQLERSSYVRLQAQPRVDTQIPQGLHPDIQKYQLFVKNQGGHTGGWETNDHLLFTRFLQKCKGSDEMMTVLLDLMPDKTAEEIEEHESWYHDYLTLKEAHRKAIQEWREEQRANKLSQHCQEPDNNAQAMDGSTQGNKLVDEKRQRDPDKEKIKQWKQIQEERQKEVLKHQQEIEKQERERWKRKTEYCKQQLLLRKKAEQEIEAQFKSHSESAETQRLLKVQQPIKQSLRNFWDQDRQFIQRRMMRIRQHNAFTNLTRSSSRSSSHSRVQVERDPTRLLQTTAVWRARTKRSLSEDNRGGLSHQGPLFIADIPHLAIPKWREGLV